MSNTYTLTFVNNSDNNWDFCCFQEDPNISTQDVQSLAWFAFPVAPTTSVSFSWTIDYQFVWSQTGQLGAGVVFTASQKWEASLTGNNGVDFTRKPNQAFTFENLAPFGNQGTLYINQDSTIPNNTAAVGINMGIVGAPPAPARARSSCRPSPTSPQASRRIRCTGSLSASTRPDRCWTRSRSRRRPRSRSR